MHASSLLVAPVVAASPGILALQLNKWTNDGPGVALPRPEVQLVVRFGPAAAQGLDVHVLGGRQRVHRKPLRGGQRIVTARLSIGAVRAVLGMPASALAGRTVPLAELWTDQAMRRLVDRLASTRDSSEAARVLEAAIDERLRSGPDRRGPETLVAEAAARLAWTNGNTNVDAVARDLGVSERHLRRIFFAAVGMNPKAFAKVARFHRAVAAARAERRPRPRWASIAVLAGYYDQAHLIADFHAVAGVTPQTLMNELRAAHAMG